MEDKLKKIYKMILRFREERDWKKYHTPKNLSQAIGIEAAELQEIFLWKTNKDSQQLNIQEIDQLKDEIADILIYILYICREFDIDPLDSVELKIKKNEAKYPVEKCKGLSIKYTELS